MTRWPGIFEEVEKDGLYTDHNRNVNTFSTSIVHENNIYYGGCFVENIGAPCRSFVV